MTSVLVGADGIVRCAWVGNDAEYQRYHDEEWGCELRDSERLYEKICLEGFQSGLSWITILKRRAAFRELFADFQPEIVAGFSDADVDRLLQDARIIRHRGKIEATIANAQATRALDRPLSELVWSFAPAPQARPRELHQIPAVTAESTALSRELRAHGFRFVGPTTMYALMQSAGLVDDHVAGCHRATQAERMAQIAIPCIWIQSDAASAIRFYTGLVPDSDIYSLAELPDPSGSSTVISEFRLGGVHYRAIGGTAPFALNESFSISIACNTQEEIDHYWSALTEGGVAGRCGWLVDRWGLSWQIIPERLGALLQDGRPERAKAAREAMFTMSKLVIAELEAAADAAGQTTRFSSPGAPVSSVHPSS